MTDPIWRMTPLNKEERHISEHNNGFMNPPLFLFILSSLFTPNRSTGSDLKKILFWYSPEQSYRLFVNRLLTSGALRLCYLIY